MRLFENDGRDFDALRAGFEWRIPERYNIGVDVCDRHADGSARLAVLTESAAGDEARYTFDALRSLSNRFANALAALGVSRGDRVAIVLPQRIETVIAHVAIYKLGAVALPLAVLFGRDALEYRLRDSGARVALTDGPHHELIESLRADIDTLEHVLTCADVPGGFWRLLERGSDEHTPVDTRADDPALLIYTSGTTGPPKGALGARRALLGNLPGFELSQNFFPADGDLMWTPADWAWTGGLLDALLPALRYGVPVLGFDGGKFDPERAFHLLAKHRVRNGFIPPTALKLMMQVPDPKARFDLDVRAIMSAGEQVGVEAYHFAEETLGVRVNEMWGQTEFNYLVGNCSAVMDPVPGSMGKPYPGHDVVVLAENGEPAADGEEVGELAARVGDPVMFLGYWQRDDATREKITGEWFRTGDLGYRDPTGHLWFVGRKDDVISSAGYRVGPGEVEDCLLKHPAVAQAAVIGSPDPVRGQIIKAFVVLAEGHHGTAALVEDIQESVRTRLAAYEYPREIEFIDALPMTTTGKIRRMDLRRLESQRKGGEG